MDKKIKILHLEDSLYDSELIHSLIEKGGISNEYYLAQNEKEFITILENENIDIILSDYSLPDYNGNEALKITREKYSNIPFIFVSGLMGEDAAINSMLNGATDYVLKNILERLVPAIKRALHEHYIEIESKRAEKAMRVSEEKYRNIFENAQDVFYQTDLTGIILDISPSIKHFTEFERNEIIGLQIADLCYNQIDKDVLLNALIKTGEFMDYELRLKTKTGGIKYVSINARIFSNSDDKPNHIDGAIRDITERKTNEKIIIKAKEKAEEDNRLKSIFLTNLSNELRTPLNGILGFTHLITGTDDKQQIVDFAKIINKGGNQLLTIIEDLFIVSSILSENIIKKITEIRINNLLDKARFIINDEILKSDKTGLTFSVFKRVTDESSLVMADIDMFGEIIRKLIRNAIKFTNSGEIEIGYFLEDKNKIIFYVKDTGIGIPGEKQVLIFDLFSQIEESTNREFGGIGTGLAICKSFIEKMNGTIWVESQPGKGSTFNIKLPLVDKQMEKQSPSIINYKDELKIDLSNKTILVVDSVDANSLYLDSILKDMGSKVISAQNGQVALDIVTKIKTIDLILMDLNMPVMDGYESTKLIKKIRPDIPVIAQTAYALPDNIEKAYNSVYDAVIKKPIIIDELITTMKECFTKAGNR